MNNYLIRCGEISQHVTAPRIEDVIKFASKLFHGQKVEVKQVGLDWDKKSLEFKNTNTFLHNNLEVGQEVCINSKPHVYNGINQKYGLHEFFIEGSVIELGLSRISTPLLLSRDELALFINPQDVKKPNHEPLIKK